MKRQLGLSNATPWMYLLSSGNQVIADSTWTAVTFATANSSSQNMPVVPATGQTYVPFRAATPTRLYLPQTGLLVLICEVCFQADATPADLTQIRSMRTVVNTATSTPLEIVTQAAIKVPAAVGAGQHMMLQHFGPVELPVSSITVNPGDYIELQVWQNSGGNLNLKSDGIAAQQIMAFYVDF